jgi:hypothetical protein
MAEFCQECSYELFGYDTKDFANPNMEKANEEGNYLAYLCEGCGHILVDHKGFRQSKKDSEYSSKDAYWWEPREDGKTEINLADYKLVENNE